MVLGRTVPLTRSRLQAELDRWRPGKLVTPTLLLAKYYQCYKQKYGLLSYGVLADEIQHFRFFLRHICTDGNIALKVIELAFKMADPNVQSFSNSRFINGFSLIPLAVKQSKQFTEYQRTTDTPSVMRF